MKGWRCQDCLAIYPFNPGDGQECCPHCGKYDLEQVDYYCTVALPEERDDCAKARAQGKLCLDCQHASPEKPGSTVGSCGVGVGALDGRAVYMRAQPCLKFQFKK